MVITREAAELNALAGGALQIRSTTLHNSYTWTYSKHEETPAHIHIDCATRIIDRRAPQPIIYIEH